MNLLIFGATGSIGRELVRQALEQDHNVTAFTRDVTKIDTKHANLQVVQGDAMEPVSIENAIQNHDVVLCSLGAGRKGTIRSKGTQNIVHAMEKKGVRRFICQSTLGIGDSHANLNFLWKYIMFGILLRAAYADHVAQEDYVKQSQLDWTIVRPGAFTDGEHTGIYQHGFLPTDKTIELKISRADVADFMLKQLSDSRYLHKTPGLSY